MVRLPKRNRPFTVRLDLARMVRRWVCSGAAMQSHSAGADLDARALVALRG